MKNEILQLNATLSGNGSIKVPNKAQAWSGMHGIDFLGKVDISNVAAGQSITISIDEKEVANVGEAGGSVDIVHHSESYAHQPFVQVGYTATGKADVSLVLYPNPVR